MAPGPRPGGPPVSEAEWAERIREWFPPLRDGRLRQVTWPAIEAHRDYIVEQLKRGVTMATIHQRLSDEHGLACSVASLRRWVRANLPEELRREQVTVLRLTPPEPGKKPRSITASWGGGLIRRPAPMALPGEAFELATWSRGKVGPDIHVKVGRCL